MQKKTLNYVNTNYSDYVVELILSPPPSNSLSASSVSVTKVQLCIRTG